MDKDILINIALSEHLLTIVGRQINLARIPRGLSLDQLSEKSGCPVGAIAKIEDGCSNSLFINISKIMNCMSLADDIKNIADPNKDEIGIFLARCNLPEIVDENKYNEKNYLYIMPINVM